MCWSIVSWPFVVATHNKKLRSSKSLFLWHIWHKRLCLVIMISNIRLGSVGWKQIACLGAGHATHCHASAGDRSRVGLLSHIFLSRYFPPFIEISKQLVTYWISHSYLTGVTAAELQWHLSNMNVIWIFNIWFCNILNLWDGEINERRFSNPHLRAK